jgi:hypothetical protein
MLRSPLTERACVYWEVNDGFGGDAPSEFEGVAFWLEDSTGRVLVRANELDVAARAERRTEAIAIVDANIKQVSRRIQEIKRERRDVGGPRATELHQEHRYLKRLATLLCAIGAHARGNVHVGGNLDGQEAYIRERSPQFNDDRQSTDALNLMGERFEVILEEGAEVEVSGLCVLEPIPPGMGHGGGYRDAPTCMHMRAPAGSQLYVRGLGEAAPRPAPAAGNRTSTSGPDANPDAKRPGLLRRMFAWITG